VILQLFEITRQRDADDVRPCRQELAELDVARPEPGERRRQPRLRSAAARPFDEPPQAQHDARRRWQHRRIDEAEHTFAGTDEASVAEADKVRGAGDHKRQPQCSATMPPVMSL
jgi:hypothetical protein